MGEGIEGAQAASLSLPGAVAARDGELVRRRLRARSDEQWGRGEKTTKTGRWQLGHLGRPGGLLPSWAGGLLGQSLGVRFPPFFVSLRFIFLFFFFIPFSVLIHLKYLDIF